MEMEQAPAPRQQAPMAALQRRIILRYDPALLNETDYDLRSAGDAGPPGDERIAALRVETATLTAREIAELARDRTVAASAGEMPVRHVQSAPPEPGDDLPPTISWGLRHVGAENLPATAGAGISVAILDTGIDAGHPAFAGLIGPDNYVDFTGTGLSDSVGHGTHCAGTILGRDVAVGGRTPTRIGIARGITRPLIAKVLDMNGGSSEAVVNGALWALQQGAHVVSMSLGLDFAAAVDAHRRRGLPPAAAYSLALAGYRETLQMFDHLVSLAGVRTRKVLPLFIAAAGNSSDRDSFAVKAEPPAASTGVISVGAVGPDLSVWAQSNTEPLVVAPGVEIWSAVPGGGLAPNTGTSMATPHVAGVAAVLAQRLTAAGRFSPARLRDALMASARPLPGDPADLGDGIPVLE